MEFVFLAVPGTGTGTIAGDSDSDSDSDVDFNSFRLETKRKTNTETCCGICSIRIELSSIFIFTGRVHPSIPSPEMPFSECSTTLVLYTLALYVSDGHILTHVHL